MLEIKFNYAYQFFMLVICFLATGICCLSEANKFWKDKRFILWGLYILLALIPMSMSAGLLYMYALHIMMK